MAASMDGILDQNLCERIRSCRVLMVGAGGIGCELLKNLVLTGFKKIDIIDLDTIDVSNLNRQFLFRKEHVGKSKAQVAKEGALLFNTDVDITAYHDSIMSTEYGGSFFKKFDVVMNALDNRAARNHVNRMCLAADVPLIESGTAGYLGQVEFIKKGLTACYECLPKPPQKTFPGCTIRNTPSEPIHCIVWAKHLFNQLYGEADPDQDVSPDTEDPEAVGDAGKMALELASNKEDIKRKSTRVWAEEIDYEPHKLFNKFFRDDIRYLLSMENLWKKRKPPTPVDFHELSESDTCSVSTASDGLICDQRLWSLKECLDVFTKSVDLLKHDLHSQESGAMLVWDKDSEAAMNFVVSAANIRSFIFSIPIKSKFDIKSMAGNIIPAIATTNAIVAGVIVMEAIKVLTNQWNTCRTVYLNRLPTERKKLIVPNVCEKPNPKCYVCSEKPQVTVRLNVTSCTVKILEDKILKSCLGMVAPDVEIDDGKGTILISSEAGETEDNWTKFLSDFGIESGSILKCDDFLQEYNLNINILHSTEKLDEEAEFELVGDTSSVHPEGVKSVSGPVSQTASNGQMPSTSTANNQGDKDDDLMVVEEDEFDNSVKVDADISSELDVVKDKRRSLKRKAARSDDDESDELSTKKACITDSGMGDAADSDDVLLID